MTYAQCFTQSTTGKASVKCTYAEVCNEQGAPIFIFQSERFSGPIATAAFDPSAIRPNAKIAAELTDEAVAVLTEYYNTYIVNRRKPMKRHMHTSNHKYLRDYFDADGNMISRSVSINPFRYSWMPVASPKNNSSNLALLVAAGSALLD